jgi:hypothetical protein
MNNRSAQRPNPTPAQRGQIIQRVIVDGWTTAEAACAAGLSERLVDIWVADYRRYGMASLHHAKSRSAAAEILGLRPLRAVFRRILAGVRRVSAPNLAAGPAQLRRSNDDRRGGGS